MKYVIPVFAAIFCMALAAPAMAQNPQAEAEFQRFLANHPDVRANPSLLSNQHYLANHPNIARFLTEHPGIHQQARMMGAYDTHHVWRDSGWWYQHDPNWAYQNHPDWFESHPEWRHPGPPPGAGERAEGEYDAHHHWYDKHWWVQHHKDWVEQHHPEWFEHHPGASAQHHEYHEHD